MFKLVPRIFVENSKSWVFCSYCFSQSDLIKPRFCLERLFIACLLDECLSLLELLSESIPSSHFVQETLQKLEFVVNVEKLTRQTQEIMAELWIVLDLRTKRFHTSNTETESVSHSEIVVKMFFAEFCQRKHCHIKNKYLIKLF